MKMVLWALVTLALLASMVRAQSPVCRLQKCKLIGHDLTSRRDTYNYEIEGNTIEIINYKFGAPVLEVHCKGSNVLGSPALPRFNPTLHVQKITLENCPLPATNLGHTFATLNVTFCESVIPENPCELSLNDVPIEQLSTKHFFGLERLQVLKVNNFNLKSNEQMSVGCDFLTVLNSLRELRISYAAMPIEFTLPPFLETLSLESTGTERLPEVIPSSLTYINVKGDNLLNARAVPPGLRQLYLGSSATSLKFDKAPALEMLWMVKWTELLPQPVMACSVLREIYLEAASMRTLPDSWLVNCTSLVDIEITGAKNLTTLPLTLFAPGGPLTRLVLRHGSLETLPEGLLHHLPNLEILDLHNNRLRTIPITSFSWLHRLLSVDISSNDVDGSVLEAVANKSLRRWLNDVNLSNNPRIGDLCSESYRGENGYSRLYNVRYLHELWLGWTNVTRICRDWRERMDKLEMLDLRNTSITELTFEDLQFARSVRSQVFLRGAPVTSVRVTREEYNKAALAPPSFISVDTDATLECDCNMYWARRVLDHPRAQLSLPGLSELRCISGSQLRDISSEDMLCPAREECGAASLEDGCVCTLRPDDDPAQDRRLVFANCQNSSIFVPRRMYPFYPLYQSNNQGAYLTEIVTM